MRHAIYFGLSALFSPLDEVTHAKDHAAPFPKDFRERFFLRCAHARRMDDRGSMSTVPAGQHWSGRGLQGTAVHCRGIAGHCRGIAGAPLRGFGSEPRGLSLSRGWRRAGGVTYWSCPLFPGFPSCLKQARLRAAGQTWLPFPDSVPALTGPNYGTLPSLSAHTYM